MSAGPSTSARRRSSATPWDRVCRAISSPRPIWKRGAASNWQAREERGPRSPTSRCSRSPPTRDRQVVHRPLHLERCWIGGHWGDIHERTNQYEAELTIAPLAGHWKITGLDLVREERL